MRPSPTQDQERLSALAQSLDCLPEEDFCLLADITPGTSESWRKRGKGPAYVLIGNRYLYPRKAVAEYLQSIVKTRTRVEPREML